MTFRANEDALLCTHALKLIDLERMKAFVRESNPLSREINDYNALVHTSILLRERREQARQLVAHACAPWFEHQPAEAST